MTNKKSTKIVGFGVGGEVDVEDMDYANEDEDGEEYEGGKAKRCKIK